MDEPTRTITGVVNNITFQSQDPESDFAILKVRVDDAFVHDSYVDKNGLAAIQGELKAIHPGEKVQLTGRVRMHKVYGQYIRVESITLTEPRTVSEIQNYLAKNISYIDRVKARKIVEQFGDQTLAIIDADPEKLLTIQGIGKKTLAAIKAKWEEQRAMRSLILFCTQLGLGSRFVYKIFKAYGNAANDRIRRDPYTLARDIGGIGFQKADEVAKHLGVPEWSEVRIRAAARHVLEKKAQQEGHCFLFQSELVAATLDTLQTQHIEVPQVEEAITAAVGQRLLCREDYRLYLPSLLRAEAHAASMLSRMLADPLPPPLAGGRAETLADEAVAAAPFELHDRQQEAVQRTLASKVSIITGGPGTGKTTVTQTVVDAYRRAEVDITLLAPTGRAAKRMGEVIQAKAHTIHLIVGQIERSIREGGAEEAALLQGVVIVDETSMVDVQLLTRLLKVVSSSTVLVFVGDDDQLPSVGPGAVLRDLIACGVIPCTKLTHVFRQAAGSDIAVNAHSIRHGTIERMNLVGADLGYNAAANMHIFYVQNPENIGRAVLWMATAWAPAWGFSPSDCQILSPMHDGNGGVKQLNAELQKALNPQPADGFERGFGVAWGVGDRLMQCKNNYHLEVFNGDLGVLRAIHRDDSQQVEALTIDFDGRQVRVPQKCFGELKLAYATTIHKSQGSEFPMVLVVVPNRVFLLNRNLLYTAVTRGKKMVVIVADANGLSHSLRVEKASTRNTYLAERVGDAARAVPAASRPTF